jgi:hypothetical protein
VLSKPLHYAAECNVIAKVPRMGLFKCERPEIKAWDFAEYARLLAPAKAEGEDWYAAVCLAGEAGLRVGEVKALRWREDVDMIARTITVRQQTCNGVTTTPKGRTRRTVPMTTTSTTRSSACRSCGKASWSATPMGRRSPMAKQTGGWPGSADALACRSTTGTGFDTATAPMPRCSA